MVAFEASFFYAIFGFSLGLLCLYLFGRLSKRNRFIWVVWSVWTILAQIIPGGLVLLYYFTPTPEASLYYVNWQLCAFSSMISIVLLCYIFITLNPGRYGWLKLTFFLFFLGVAVALINIFNPETVTSQQLGAFVLQLPPYAIVLFLIGYLPVFQVGFRYLHKIRSHVLKNKIKFGNLFSLGICLLILSYPLSFTLSSFIASPIFGALFIGVVSAGGVCIAYTIAQNQRILYLIPDQVIEVSIFHKSGVKLFSLPLRAGFQPTELKQGAIMGLQGLLTDLLGNDIVQEIKLRDRHVLLMSNQRLGYIAVLATLQIHRIMKFFLQEFARAFEEHFRNELQKCIDINNPVDPSKFKPFETLTRQLFAI